MQASPQHRDSATNSLGQRRGISDLARFALDLTWARAESELAARSGDYPSPPMSGSPPLPPKSSQEAGDRSQGSFQTTTSQDVYLGGSMPPQQQQQQQGDIPRGPSTIPPPTARQSYHGESPQDRAHSYLYGRHPDEGAPRPPLQYTSGPQQQPPQHQMMLQQHSYLPMPGQLPGPGVGSGLGGPVGATTVTPIPPPAYGMTARPPVPEPAQAPYGSPKSQRKAKGHVASACVPCKRAHLRCDAQRPCSRCLASGKEESCIDVQHKKRGRPRLRDDQGRFDPSRYGQSHTPEAAIRRPMPGFAPSGPSGYDDSLRRSGQYRILKSQPMDNVAPRFLERGASSDSNIFPAPLSITTRTPEPAAFLTMELEVAKASPAFLEALGLVTPHGSQQIKGRKLTDLIGPMDREKALSHQRQMQAEQAQREPNYLPPIYGKQEEDRVIQSLGFGIEDLSRFQLDRTELFTFQGAVDGQQRIFSVRMGLAKVESIYLIVLLLSVQPRTVPYPSPSPHTRDIPYSYGTQQQAQFSQPTPVSASFDPNRQRLSEGSLGPRKSSAPAQMISGGMGGMGSLGGPPGLSSSSFSPNPGRGEYSVASVGPSFQPPRGEMMPQSTATTRLAPQSQQQQPEFQLPPIRNPSQPSLASATSSSDQLWPPRDDRSNRVDIGGLIDKPDPNRRPTH